MRTTYFGGHHYMSVRGGWVPPARSYIQGRVSTHPLYVPTPRHTHPSGHNPPPREQTHAYKNITFPLFRWREVKMTTNSLHVSTLSI